MSYGRTYELCRNHYDPTYGDGCNCGSLLVATCTDCGAIVDDQQKHDSWHVSLRAALHTTIDVDVIQRAIADDMGCDDPQCGVCKYRAALVAKALQP